MAQKKKKRSSRKKVSKKTTPKKKTVKVNNAKKVVKVKKEQEAKLVKKVVVKEPVKAVSKKVDKKKTNSTKRKKGTVKIKTPVKKKNPKIVSKVVEAKETNLEVKKEEIEVKAKKEIFTWQNMMMASGVLIIIIMLVTTVYLMLNKILDEKNYENKANEVLVAAIKWAEENQISVPQLITVNYLITEKYVIPDEANGNYFNPRDEGKLLNCNTVFIEKNNGAYKATFNDETDCDLMISEQLPIELISMTSGGTNIKSGEESNTDIILVVYSRLKTEQIIWYVDGEEIVSKRNNDSYIISSNQTVRIVVETNRGTKEFKFIANINKL